ncbi:MAG TPA: ABC transporter substrate-binding protein, partial [Mycobacteriales bacterium]|nr:ABC transporter substrate-binding protein [Mycobacteriales bacterium]
AMTSPRTSARLAAAVLAATALTAACGLKPEATDSLKATGAQLPAAGNAAAGGVPAPGGTTAPVPGASLPGGSDVGGGGAVAGGAGGVSAGSSGGAAGSGGSTGSTAPGGHVGSKPVAQPAAGSCGVPHGGTTTGITNSTINIGLHAPLTGTGTPFPNNSFKAGAGTFWQQPGHTVCGRKVNVEFQDDTYTPSGARTVCSAMAKRDFFVVGGGGTDQIQACATDPDIQRLGVPYLSAGVTDNGLNGLNNYFAVSLTYRQQGGLVLRNAQQQGIANPRASNQKSDNIPGQNAKWAIVTANTPNFAGARDGMEAALKAAHIPYKSYQVSQQGNYQSAATQFGSQLALNGFQTIYVDAAPGYFVFMTGGYYGAHVGSANWVGPGVTYTEVTVAQYVCSTSKGAISGHAYFLSPAPGLDRATPDFKKAYNGKYDDIEWALWGLSETLFALLKDASGNLTRQNFIAAATHATVPASVYPPVDFLHNGGHFGGTGAWVQRVNCSKTEPNQNQPGTWDTVGSKYLVL